MKTCTVCLKEQPLEAFYGDKSKKTKTASRCRECNKEYCKRWFNNNKGKTRSQALEKKYGLSSTDYSALHFLQEGKCKICGLPQTDKMLAVDHDHKTGKVRGLLCSKCNKGIGLFKDDPELLKKAIEYLK